MMILIVYAFPYHCFLYSLAHSLTAHFDHPFSPSFHNSIIVIVMKEVDGGGRLSPLRRCCYIRGDDDVANF
jgi:hypothetical protein